MKQTWSVWRRVLVRSAAIVIVVGVVLLALECTAKVFLYLRNDVRRSDIVNTLYSAEVVDQGEQITARDTTPAFMRGHVLHPYLGFVLNRDVKQHSLGGLLVRERVNELGFFGDSPVKTHSSDVVWIAITGGSVATELFLYSRPALLGELEKHARFAGKRIRFVSLALGGTKQPQQLLTLTYLLSLGYKFDVLVNLDGFNEVALPPAENVAFGVFPYFPRSWRLYASKSLPLDAVSVIGLITRNKMETQSWARLASHPTLRRSDFALVIWRLYQQRQYRKRLQLERELNRLLTKRALTFQESGPSYSFEPSDDISRDTVELWRTASVQMWRLCQQNGIAYFHFLQPNQYAAGTKVFSAWEQEHAFGDETHPYRPGAEKGYPLLIEAGRQMRASEVPFVDLTQIFAGDTATIYRDACCHYLQEGYDKVARKIAAVIAGADG